MDLIKQKFQKDSIALHLGGDSWDYPFFGFVKEKI